MNKMKEWYSITELAEETKIPEPTVRRYITKFQPYFISKGGSRAKKYDSSAIDLLKRIQKLYAAGYETIGVSEVIKNEFPVIMSDKDLTEMDEKPNLPTLATAEDVAEIKQALAEQKEFNKLLIQKLGEQERSFKEALENRDQLLLERLAEKEEDKEEQKDVAAKPPGKGETSFWKRFFK